MAVIKELIRNEADGTLSFGDYTLSEKAKVEDFDHKGDMIKVKTYSTMTKLEKNGLFIYESVPGTSVNNFNMSADGVEFSVEAAEDAQLTIGLNDDTSYEAFVNGESVGIMKTNLGGKLNISVELNAGEATKIVLKKQ